MNVLHRIISYKFKIKNIVDQIKNNLFSFKINKLIKLYLITILIIYAHTNTPIFYQKRILSAHNTYVFNIK